MARRYNVRRVKLHWSYSISEAAKLLGVHKLTVSRWIERGLPLIEQKRPFLARVATARRRKPCPTLGQIRTVLDAMPAGTEIERRDRALIAFAILTGARDRAIVSFKLKHIDIEHELLEQDARQVLTKRAKTFTTWFFLLAEKR